MQLIRVLVIIGALLGPQFKTSALPSLKSSLNVTAVDNVVPVNTIEQDTIEQDTIDQNKDLSLNEINHGDNFYQGDIIISPGMRPLRNLLKLKHKLWPRGQHFYFLDKNMVGEASILSKIRSAAANLNQLLKGCITITETTDPKQLSILMYRRSRGCAAHVGYVDGTMYLSEECSVGNIMHEFLHSLGMMHEHERSDRDDFVRINFENIQNGSQGEFEKANPEEFSEMKTPYDLTSIMHYGTYAFSRNGKATIEQRKPGPILIGQRVKPSEWDVKKVKIMYGCQA